MTSMSQTSASVDQAEIAKFEAMAAEWWDPNGKFRPLHLMNPLRLDYVTAQIAAEFGRDIGKGVAERAGQLAQLLDRVLDLLGVVPIAALHR